MPGPAAPPPMPRRRYLHKEHMRAAIAQVVNALLEVLDEDAWKAPMKPEDWCGLTPLFYQHINPL